MDVILKVLEGAKTGTKIAVKKDEFFIGRSQKCHLCAGSSSVSRRHCVIRRKESAVTIEDLGSRNGTLLNGKKITGEVALTSGDEIGIGTLKMLLTISHGINNLKRPKVKTVADAVDRAVVDGGSSVGEEDITSWLLDTESEKSPSSQVMNETQTIRMDDTNAVHLREHTQDAQQAKAADKASPTEAPGDTDSKSDDTEASDSSKSGLKKSKGKKKAEPGKLPPVPHEPASKDSREAAMQALRNWNRRR